METLEFEVKDALPPKYRSDKSIWVDKEEAKQVIRLRKEALKYFNGKKPFVKGIKLEIEIWTPKPEGHEKPGDLDNFIKGICDSLYPPLSSLNNPNFPIHETFKLPENRDIHPMFFMIIIDDEQIKEIWARMNYIEPEGSKHYRIRIEGSSGEK